MPQRFEPEKGQEAMEWTADFGVRWLQRLSNNAIATLVLRISAAALSFTLGVILARLMGLGLFGSYSVLLAMVNVGAAVALLGHDTLANRDVATAAKPQSYLRAASKQVWVAALLVMLGAALVSQTPALNRHAQLELLPLLLLIPLIARTRLAEGAIRGSHRASLALVADGLLRPSTAIVALAMLSAIGWLSGPRVVAVLLLCSLLALVTALHWEARSVAARPAPPAGGATGVRRFSLGLYLSSLLSIATNQAPLIVAGLLADATLAGLFAAAERLTFATMLIAQTIYLSISSRVAALHAAGERLALDRLAIRQTRLATALTLGVCAVVFIYAEELLSIYGRDFADGADALRWLLAGSILCAAIGPVGPMLTMTRHEKDYLLAMLVSMLVQIAAYAMFVPGFGLGGIVAAVVIGCVAWNVAMAVMVWYRLGVSPLFILRRLPRKGSR
jgi:O-antigen/teichoic acid export membrane protein